MEQTKIAVFGASGHAKVVINIIQALSEDVVSAVYDDDDSVGDVAGFKVVSGIPDRLTKGEKAVIAIGDNKLRAEIAGNSHISFVKSLAHPSAVVSASAKIGSGTVIMPNAVINAEVSIGKHCIVNTGAVIEHEVILDDFVHVSPQAVLTGNIRVGEGAHIGAGASIIPGVQIGKWCTIGAGAVIIEDVPDFSTVVGNPGKIIT